MKRALAVAALAASLVLGACTAQVRTDAPAITPQPVPTEDGNPSGTCANPAQTLPAMDLPAVGNMPKRTILSGIAARDHLVVGVVGDQQPMVWRDPLQGDFKGFEVDLYHRVAEDLLGDPDKVLVKVVTANDALGLLNDHSVDVVVGAMAMTCGRWDRITMSAPYLTASQRVLSHKGSGIGDFASLQGKRVCVVGGTPYADAVRGAQVVPARTATACLVKLQSGEVDAVTDTGPVLAGLAAQDPWTEVAGPALAEFPLAVGVAKDYPLLAQFVSASLAKSVADGAWQKSYDTWLAPSQGPAQAPTPDYGRPA